MTSAPANSATLTALQSEVSVIEASFAGPRWTPEVCVLDLVEEVGELANAVLTMQGHKSIKRSKSGVRDAIGDVLYSILMVATSLEIDASSCIRQVLDDLPLRQSSGEFDS